VEQLSRLAEQVQHLPPDDDPMWQQHRLAPFAMAWRMAGNFPPMVAALQEMRKVTRISQNSYLELQALWGLIVALIGSGQISQAHERVLELHQLVDRLGGPLPVAGYPELFQAQLAYTWNQLEVAKKAAEIAIEKAAPFQYMDILMSAYDVLGRCCLAQGDLTGAEHAVREMERVNQAAGIPLFRPEIESLRVQLWLAQGDLTRAGDWAAHTPYRESALFYSYESASLALVRVYLAELRYPQALQLLVVLLGAAEQVSRVGSVIAILALQVAALQASGATHEALRALNRLLTEAMPEGYRRVFLDAGIPMR
jgi:LuxR family maltose regulon positive regulatory protein